MASGKSSKIYRSGGHAPELPLDGESQPVADLSALRRSAQMSAELALECDFFLARGIAKSLVTSAHVAAISNATTIEQELLAQGLVESEFYYRWMADQLGLGYLDHIDPGQVVRLSSMDALLRGNGPLRLVRGRNQVTVIVPEAKRFETEKSLLAARPALRRGLMVGSPATIRSAVWQADEDQRVRQTTFQLDEDHKQASARQVLTGVQGFVLALLLCLSVAAFVYWPFRSFAVLHLVLTMFFTGGLVLRLCAFAAKIRNRPEAISELDDDVPPPVYTILIALREEAEMVPAMASRIAALHWPKSRLDVKYICEKGDRATIMALEAQNLGPECEIVQVPDFGPRTKPKALQYALKGARGTFLTVYDAEDKPAPGQLLEAWATFRRGSDRLGCLQAPLAVANLGSGWLSGLFALEYGGLFRVLVPFLARTGLPIPLGGTSNHFRRAVLEDVGGWDPHNVTEDADLGMRLYAHGYRTGIIKSATVETSPVSLGVWIRQRTRWLKGWAQTWLVAMRRPVATFCSLGPGGFLVFQLLIAGMLVSALAHPMMFVFIALTLTWLAEAGASAVSLPHAALMGIDVFNIVGSYLTFAIIGWSEFTMYERTRMKARWLTLVPVYWLLMSCRLEGIGTADRQRTFVGENTSPC